MPIRNKYLISMIPAGVACVISVIFLILFPSKTEVVLNWIQFGCLLFSLGGMVNIILKERASLFYEIQIGAIACFTLGQVFWITHLLVLGYDDKAFSVSDLSWIGFYLFLLSAVIGVLNPEALDKGKKFIKYKIFALLASAIVLFSGIVELFFVIENNLSDVFYVTIYTVVMLPLSYFTFKLLILPTGENLRIKCMKPYLLLINAILITDIVWTFSNLFKHEFLFYLCEFLLSIMILLIVPTAYGGYRKWETY